jgi:2-keto-4-pentenoate hydratase/2-oxohepta-3-ene-1,7-dioic acid hydratase in catechol pathway
MAAPWRWLTQHRTDYEAELAIVIGKRAKAFPKRTREIIFSV